jgi:hypothetical protein
MRSAVHLARIDSFMKKSQQQTTRMAHRIEMYAIEKRTMIRPGFPPVTIVREVEIKNGKGRKTVKVTRADRVISNVTERLNGSERHKITKRKYVKGLYKKAERKTLRRLAYE